MTGLHPEDAAEKELAACGTNLVDLRSRSAGAARRMGSAACVDPRTVGLAERDDVHGRLRHDQRGRRHAREDPIFMGSSFGGNVALQLALRRPDRFSGVISVEGAAYSPGFYLDWWQHPHANAAQVCASGVWDLMAPQSPEPDRWKTWFYYSQGSEAFKGDLYFYSVDHDLRSKLGDIDGDQCPVVMLTGEYDYLTTPKDSRHTAEQIKNGAFIEMKEIGHFPMSENHAVFRRYLIEALDVLRKKGAVRA
jgi:pimeloyl-ACP methyl ester carboxylesterase